MGERRETPGQVESASLHMGGSPCLPFPGELTFRSCLSVKLEGYSQELPEEPSAPRSRTTQDPPALWSPGKDTLCWLLWS